MKKFRVLATALAAAAFLAGCGGNDAGNQAPRVAFTQMVNFGDSLSDVGSYRTAIVASNGPANKTAFYSINGDLSAQGLTYTNWTQYVAAQLDLAQPCSAEVGLASVGALSFLFQATADSATCLSYAQGGAMVTSPVGPGNAYLFTQYHVPSGQLGQLTKPIHDQIASYLTAHTAFTSGQIVTVMAGGNDLLLDRALTVDATVSAILAADGVNLSQTDIATIATAANNAVAQMTAAAHQLATLITGQIIANGATHVVVVNIPDVAVTPDAAIWLAQGAGQIVEPIHPHLTLDMVNAFNNTLAADLGVTASSSGPQSSHAEIAWVDAFASNADEVAHPSLYGLTNVTTPACKLTPAIDNPSDPTATGLSLGGGIYVPIATSLFCSQTTLITDSANATSIDPHGVMHYLFADTVHPTPYVYRLLAELVGKELSIKGWL